ncbi:MAG TPA: alkaline phosphatase family protein, partial [Polyangiaceae bacterium]
MSFRASSCWFYLLLLAGVSCKHHRAQGGTVAKPKPAYDWTPPPPSAASAVSSAPARLPRSAQARRDACEFKAGALPEQTSGADEPIGQRIPIDHFVMVMQENRSFDQYFQGLPKFGQPGADVAPADFHNRDSYKNRDIKLFHSPLLCSKDTRHDWNSAHAQFDDGKM